MINHRRSLVCFVIVSTFIILVLCDETPEEIKRQRAFLIRKHLKRLKKQEGGIKLVGGRGEFEGKNNELLIIGSECLLY